jgi:hypothetical protein
MSTVSGTYTSLGNELVDLLETTNDGYAYAAGRIGTALSTTNEDLLKATTAKEDSPELRELALKYGLITKAEKSKGVKVSSEAVVMAIKDAHEKRSRLMTLLSNILDSIDRTLRGIIDKIGR